MPRSDLFATGRLRQVDPTRADATEPHGFTRASLPALQDPRLSHRNFRVLAALESYCWGRDRDSWPCNRTLGLRAGGIGPNAVRQALRELEALGYLESIPDIRKFRGSRLEIRYQFRRSAEADRFYVE